VYIYIYLFIYMTYLMYFFIAIHLAVFTVTEIQTKHTVKLSTLMLHSIVLHSSVHQNHHRVPWFQKFKKHKHVFMLLMYLCFVNFWNEGARWWFWWTVKCSKSLYSIKVLSLTVCLVCISIYILLYIIVPVICSRILLPVPVSLLPQRWTELKSLSMRFV